MAVEIGQLILRATFGPDHSDAPDTAQAAMDQALEDLRRQVLSQTREMIDETLRRQREG